MIYPVDGVFHPLNNRAHVVDANQLIHGDVDTTHDEAFEVLF